MKRDSYPTRLDRFKRWAKAMEQGATVDKPTWDGSGKTRTGRKTLRKRTRRRRSTRPRRTRKTEE